MKSKVTFGENGEVTKMQVKEGGAVVAYAEMHDGGAYIRKVYPQRGHDGIQVEFIGEIQDHLEELPFVEYAKLNYNP